MKKILIFYSKTGGGHLRAAQALKEELENQNPDIRIVLHEGLETGRFGIKTKAAYVYSVFSHQLQGVYNFFYILTNNPLGTKVLRLLTRKILGRNLKKAIEHENPDLIISVNAFISKSTVKKGNSTPFITVVTDLGTPHQIWFDEAVEKIITPTELIASFAKRLLKSPPGKIIPLDYPVRKRLMPTSDESNLKNTLLILGGGEGAGNLKYQVLTLLDQTNYKLIAVCGKNQKLYRELSKIQSSRMKVVGFADNLPELYKLADIVISKAGPGTIVEAATLKKPLIITSWVGMQEKDNVNFVVENRLGIYEPNIKNLPSAVEKIYKDYNHYNQGQKFFNQGSKKIVEYLLKEFA